MNKKIASACLVLACVFSFMAVTPHILMAKTTKEDVVNKEETVYATKRGKKYHKQNCPFISDRETTPMSLQDAEKKGLVPCGKCFKQEK